MPMPMHNIREPPLPEYLHLHPSAKFYEADAADASQRSETMVSHAFGQLRRNCFFIITVQYISTRIIIRNLDLQVVPIFRNIPF
jgi:hypothetical protein